MKYDLWIKKHYLPLNDQPDVVLMSLIQQAKKDTKIKRLTIFFLLFAFAMSLSYLIGYSFSKFSSMGSWLALMISCIVGVLCITKCHSLFEFKIITTKLNALIKAKYMNGVS